VVEVRQVEVGFKGEISLLRLLLFVFRALQLLTAVFGRLYIIYIIVFVLIYVNIAASIVLYSIRCDKVTIFDEVHIFQ
jgi:hypothetical protein